MDRQRAWLKVGKKRRLRILAVILCVCVLVTAHPDIMETIFVLAADRTEQTEVRYVSGFAALPEEVREQTVPVGTGLEKLQLPDTLEAVVTGRQPSEDKEENMDESGTEQGGTTGGDGEETGGTEQPDDGEHGEEEAGSDSGDGTGDTENPDDSGSAEKDETNSGDGAGKAENPDGSDAEDGDIGGAAGIETPGEGETDGGNGTDDTENIGVSEDNSAGEEKAGDLLGAFASIWKPVVVKAAEADAPAADAAKNGKEPESETVQIAGIIWESVPSYDGSLSGDYVFTAVLPETYEVVEGVELPKITVTVEEEVWEEASVPAYASMPLDEVAPVTERTDTRDIELVSSDNAGDRHKVRILWQTIKTVSKNATSAGCEKSWIAFQVPGMNGEMKFPFTKEMLTNSSEVYTLTEFTLPYTYEDRQDIFPEQVGLYSALSLISGQFRGRVTLQAYDYIIQDWETYSYWEISPETALIGGFLAEDGWNGLDQPSTYIDYVDIDRQDLHMGGSSRTEKSWDIVLMDRFGVVVTEKSKGWTYDWKLKLGNDNPYPDKYGITLTGNMEGFKLTAVSGVNGIPAEDKPWACVIVRRNSENMSILRIGIGLSTVAFIMQYFDNTGLIHSERVLEGSAYRVADVTKAALNQGRDIVLPKGHEFAGYYIGSDGRIYQSGEEIASLAEPLNFYMQWKPKTYRVTLDGQIDQQGNRTLTGNGKYEMNLTYGKKGVENASIPPQAPDKYYFNGWVGEVGGREVLFFDKEGKPYNKWSGDGDTVLRPRWAMKNIRYSLNPGADDAWCYTGGWVLSNPPAGKTPTLAAYGAKLPRTEWEIYRYGYELAGWFTTEKEGGEQIDENYPLLLEDTTFYARWTPCRTTCTLNANGGSFGGEGQTERRIQVHYAQKFGEISDMPETPSRPGYDFKGWGYSKSAKPASVLQTDSVLEKTTGFALYAVWEKKDLTIYLDPDGGSFDNAADARVKAVVGERKTLPVPRRKGYTCTGWKDAAGKVTAGSAYTVPGDADASFTLTAVWQAKEYKVIFNRNNGSGTMGQQTLTYDASSALSPNRFTRSGYSFAGWNTAADGSGTSYADQAAVKNLADSGTFTLYAQWKPVTCSVSFDPNGGTLADSAPRSRTVTFDAVYGKDGDFPVPERKRYTFLGWFTAKEGGTQVRTDMRVDQASSHSLYAHWEYAWFTLSFDLRGGAGSKDCAFGNMDGEAGTGIEVPRFIPERTGWEFKGWSRTPGAEADPGYTAAEIQAGTASNVKPDSGQKEVTLYAVWHSDTPVMNYDANLGGVGDAVTNMPDDQQITDGRAAVSDTKPIRAGYSFMGWALAQDGQPLYKKRNETKPETIYSAVSVTLYAVWQAVEEEQVSGSAIECKYLDAAGKWQFTTLADAIGKVPAGGEIIMLKDAGTTEKNLIINRSLTLNLDGYRLGNDDMLRFLNVEGDNNVIIKNGEIYNIRFTVWKGSKTIVDSMLLHSVEVYNSGTHLTIQGKTIFKDVLDSRKHFVYVGSGGAVTVKYAEAYIECPGGNVFCIGETSGGGCRLKVEDGYFCVRSSSQYGTVVRWVEENVEEIKLLSGYYASFINGDTPVTKFSQDDSSGTSIISGRDISGTDVRYKSSLYLGIESSHWFTPADAPDPADRYWDVYSGESRVATVSEATITNDNYAGANTRFELQKNVKGVNSAGNLTLGKADQRAVIDLNNHYFSAFDTQLDSFILKNGTLEIVGRLTMTNGMVEGSTVSSALLDITLTNMILAPGATFLVENTRKSKFESRYVSSRVNFGGTVLEQEGADVTIAGHIYTPYVAKNADARVTFHSNYPSGTKKTEAVTQTIGGKYVLPAATFTAPAGYTFDHWNTKADGTGKHITAALVCHDRTVVNIYAIWRRNYVTVTFDKNGGEWKDVSSLGVASAALTAARTVPYNNALGALPTVSRTGYGFAGWYTAKEGGTPVNAGTKVTADQTYYARWAEADGTKYTVIWQGEVVGGGTKELGRAERFGKTDADVQVNSGSNSLVQAFDGYVCSGYTVRHSGNTGGTSVSGTGGSFKIRYDGSVEVTLHYQLKYEKVTVTAKKKDVTASAESPAGGVTVGLSATGHVKENGSEDKNTGMTTATATTGSAAAGSAKTWYKYGSSVRLAAPELTGYTFAGWSGDYTAAERTLSFPMSDREVAVTALYKQKACSVEKNLSHINVEAGGEKVAPASGSDSRTLPTEGIPYGYTYTLRLTALEGYDLPEQITLRRGMGNEPVATLTAGQNTSGDQSYTWAADKRTGTVTVENVTTPLNDVNGCWFITSKRY